MKRGAGFLFARLDRGAMIVMALGIVMVGQPWSHFLFRYGFVVIVAGLAVYAIASRYSYQRDRTGGASTPEPESRKAFES